MFGPQANPVQRECRQEPYGFILEPEEDRLGGLLSVAANFVGDCVGFVLTFVNPIGQEVPNLIAPAISVIILRGMFLMGYHVRNIGCSGNHTHTCPSGNIINNLGGFVVTMDIKIIIVVFEILSIVKVY